MAANALKLKDAAPPLASAPASIAAPVSVAVPAAPPRAQVLNDLKGELRVLTCGSVDDGKSTLIGRLLWDAAGLFDDQRDTVMKSGKLAGDGKNPDFSLLVDGLAAEREQGITIDIAWRFFDWGERRIVIIDSPGHEQYTRNMATGASHADVALLLVDARAGIKRQTRRHAAILDLAGVKRVILAVNKMDLVDWSEERYAEIATEFAGIAQRFGFADAIAIPVAAPSGDNVTHRSEAMPWYDGPTLLEQLVTMPSRQRALGGHFRMPVQIVLRDGRDFRGLAGTITSGSIKVGEQIRDSASGAIAHVQRIVTMDRDLKSAHAGQAVTIQLDRDLDIARGAILSDITGAPASTRAIKARLVWMSETPFDANAGYLLRSATDLVPVTAIRVAARLDLENLASGPGGAANVNDIVDVTVNVGRAMALDRFADMAGTGSVLIVDALTGATVAAGIALTVDEAAASTAIVAGNGAAFVLTRDRLAAGVCRDLHLDVDRDKEEFQRRADEVAILLRSAGITVKLDI